jgi:hypothetical protein
MIAGQAYSNSRASEGGRQEAVWSEAVPLPAPEAEPLMEPRTSRNVAEVIQR